MSGADEMTLACAFIDQSRSFTNGFELGRLEHRLEVETPNTIDCGWTEGFPLHAENADMLPRIAKLHGYGVETRPTDCEDWIAARFVYRGGRPSLRLIATPKAPADGEAA